MRKLRALWVRTMGLFSRREAREFEAELESHLEMHIEDGMRAGLSAEEARRQALIRLGGVEQTRQAYRDRRGLPGVEAIWRDLRYALRWLAKHPAVTCAAIISIGLGIGANVTIFSMINRFVLRPAPVGDPATLLAMETRRGTELNSEVSAPLYQDVRDQARSFSGVAAYYEMLPASIGGSGEPERVWGQAVTTNFFDVTQLRLVAGRGFVPGEEHAPEIVIGNALWQRRFNGDPGIVGRSVLLSGRNFTVIGIAPRGFRSVDQLLNTEFWIPLEFAGELVPGLEGRASRDMQWLAMIGRLRPGTTVSDAHNELQTVAARLAQAYPKTNKDMLFQVRGAGSLPFHERGTVVIFLSALLVVVLLVLAIAGANVANLLFAQASARQRDMAVRLAMGATRARLRRQMLVESVLLGLGGGMLGMILSLWAVHGLAAFHLPAPVPLDTSFGIDWRVTLFTFLLSCVSGVLLGLAPAWAASRPMLANALKGEDALARPGRRISLRNLLLVGQIAMSMVLLCVTGLFLRSLMSAATMNIGFHPHGLLMMSVDPRLHGYSPERTAVFLRQLRERISGLPGVVSAAATDYAPLSMGGRTDGFQLDGKSGSGEPSLDGDLFMASPGFFDTMGIPLIAGRDFSDEPAGGSIRAVVNRAFAQRAFGTRNPIGQHIAGGGKNYEIIGVVENTKSRTLGEDTRTVLYRDLKQGIASDPSFLGYTIVVRTAGDAATLLEPVRRQVQALDPAMAVFNAETMDEHIRSAYFLPRLAATLFGVFGFIGVVLTAVGLYGVINYSVSRRRREIGIRMALGAEPGSVERLILRQGIVLSLIAIALGWPAAWMLAKLAGSFLYGIQPHDIPTFVFVPLTLLAIALVACWMPARRASLVNPAETLRAE